MIDYYLTKDPNVSDELADTLAQSHESLILAFNALGALATAAGITLGNLEPRIQTHIEALVKLGRPRVAPDLKLAGWELTSQNPTLWCRRLRPDEDPTFPNASLAPPYVDEGRVYAENNRHARYLDGAITLKYGLSLHAEDFVT